MDCPYLEMPCIGVLLRQQVQARSRVVFELMLMPMNRGVTEVSAVSKSFSHWYELCLDAISDFTDAMPLLLIDSECTNGIRRRSMSNDGPTEHALEAA